jgi:hypothetical protein
MRPKDAIDRGQRKKVKKRIQNLPLKFKKKPPVNNTILTATKGH